MWDLGWEDKALEIWKMAERHELFFKHHSFFYGMAGEGMMSLYLFLRTKKQKYIDTAVNLGNMLLNSTKENGDGKIYWNDEENIYLGLGYGQSGVVLFLLRLYQLTDTEKYLLGGRKALEFDLVNSKEIEKGKVRSFASSIGDITFEQYLESGAAGVIKTLLRYRINKGIEKFIRDIHRKYSIFCGLFYGLSSFLDVFVDAFLYLKDVKYLEMAKRLLSGIKELYLLNTQKGLATPGDGLFRICF